MIKQLIVIITLLLIQDISETIYCACVILNFTMIVQYPLHDNKILSYIDHTLYRLDKIKIALENHSSIDAKVF